MTSVSRPGSASPGRSRPRICLARLHQAREHDEEVAGDARGDERVARRAEHVPGSNRREGADQPGKHPETHQQGHRDIGHQVNLQTAQLLQAQGSGRVGGDRKQSIRRQAGHGAGCRRDRVLRDLQDVEQPLSPFDADQRDAQEQREEHHRRHHVVRQRIERIRRNVEADEVEGGATLQEARTEERGILDRREGQGDQEREGQRQDPQATNHGRRRRAEPPEFGPAQGSEAGDDRDGDVGQHHHLEQLHEPVGRPFQRRRLLAEEQPGEGAKREPGDDLRGEGHAAASRHDVAPTAERGYFSSRTSVSRTGSIP